MYSLALIIFVVSEKKAFEHFPIGSNVNLCPAKFKMAATAGLNLKPLGQLKPNCPGMIIGRSSVFYADRKSKMATTAGHRLTLDPMGKCSNAFFSETTNMIKAKLYMNVH
jgi:hypothetical protein